MLKRHPFGRGGSAWALAWRLAAVARAAGRGVRGSAGLQAADGGDFLPGLNLQHEGAAAAVDDGVGAVVQRPERQHGAAAADPDQSGGEELGRQLAGETGAAVMPGQRKSRNRGI
jgi:hypothetical protein